MDRALGERLGATLGLLGTLGLGAASCGNDFRPVSIYPIYAYEDGCLQVEIGGTNFVPDGFDVKIDGQSVPVTWPEEGSLDYGYSVTVDVPPHAPGHVSVEVTSGGETLPIEQGFDYVVCDPSPRVDYAFLLDPDGFEVGYIDPAVGGWAYLVGCGFDDQTQVQVNGADAAFQAYCTTELEIEIPPSQDYGYGLVSVSNAIGVNEDVVFEYNCAGPEVTAVDPPFAPTEGGTGYVYGCGFFDDGIVHTGVWTDFVEPVLDEQTETYPPIEGTPLDTVVYDPFTLEVAFPARDAGPVDLLVANPNPGDVTGATPDAYVVAPGAVEYVDAVTIAALAPDQGAAAGGYPVDIYGTGFDGDVEVSWAGTLLDAAEFAIVDPGRISIASAPAGDPGPVTVSVSHPIYGFMAEATFYYITPPAAP